RSVWDSPPLQIGLAVAIALGLVLFTSASARAVYALPLVAALALIGAGAVRPIPIALDFALTALAAMLGLAPIGAGWGLWALLVAKGAIPARLPLDGLMPRRFEMPL